MLAQGQQMFSLHAVKNFVDYNTNNVSSNTKLAPQLRGQGEYSSPKLQKMTNASSYLDK